MKFFHFVSDFRIPTELCGSNTELSLDANGEGSSLIVHLNANYRKNVCILNVKAPVTHVINVEFIETSSIEDTSKFNNRMHRNSRCILAVVSLIKNYLVKNTQQPNMS